MREPGQRADRPRGARAVRRQTRLPARRRLRVPAPVRVLAARRRPAYTQKVLAGLGPPPQRRRPCWCSGSGARTTRCGSCSSRSGRTTRGRVRFFNAQDVADEIEEGLAPSAGWSNTRRSARREPIPTSRAGPRPEVRRVRRASAGITANPLVGRDRRPAERRCGGTRHPDRDPGDVRRRAGPARCAARRRERVRRDRRPGERLQATTSAATASRSTRTPRPATRTAASPRSRRSRSARVQKAGQSPVDAGAALRRAASPAGGARAARSAGQRRRLLDRADRRRARRDPVHHRPRHAAGLSRADAEDRDPTPRSPQRKPHWIDFDAGPLADGTATPDELADRLFDLVLDVASGTRRTATRPTATAKSRSGRTG